ncbi:hypothetical protein JCM10212_005906 [Sporobolomyces blumeae]
MASERVASSSSTPLDSISPPLSYPTPSISFTSSTEPPDTQPVPTLASLLLSTAESLVSRSTSLPTSTTPARPTSQLSPPNGPSTPFTLTASPSALLSNPETQPYLESLLSHSLPSLLALPNSLHSLSSTLDSDLATLAFTRYPAFLLSHSAAQSISSSFDRLSDSLANLLESTLVLERSAETFEVNLQQIRSKRDRIKLVRERVEQVEELLEAPSVVEACVRAGQWNEAIEVSKRIHELYTRMAGRYESRPRTTGPQADADDEGGRGALRILERVREQVHEALLGLRGRVLESLGQRGLKLPGAVRGVGILRKIAQRGLDTHRSTSTAIGRRGSFKGKSKVVDDESLDHERLELGEAGLRIVFLAARWKCLRAELDLVEVQMTACGVDLTPDSHRKRSSSKGGRVGVEENDDRTRWTKKWIEVWREIVGETVGMYSEVFLGSAALASVDEQLGTSQDVVRDEFGIPTSSLPPTAPLHLFLSTCLASLSDLLESALDSITSTSCLSTLLTQLTYCSHSFTRHGLAFDSYLELSTLFENRILEIVLSEWERAGKAWETEWRSGWTSSGGQALVTSCAKVRKSGKVPIRDWLVVPEGVHSLLSTTLPDPPRTFVVSKSKTDDGNDDSTWHHSPCPTLALLPPLAHLLNTYVTSLNSLRLLPPSKVFDPLKVAQARELERASRVLEAFVDAWLGSFNSTPLPSHASTFDGAPGGSQHSGSEGISDEEATTIRDRQEEKDVVVASIAWFGRELVPWLGNALSIGVYGELSSEAGGTQKNGPPGGDEAGLVEARKRVERLIARIEGDEWSDPDLQKDDEGTSKTGVKAGNGENGQAESDSLESQAEGGDIGDLPVLDLPAQPAIDPTVSPTTANGHATNGDVHGAGDGAVPDEPLEFTKVVDANPSTTAEPSLALDVDDGAGATSSGDRPVDSDENAPYLVDDVAPPPPAPVERGTSLEPEDLQDLQPSVEDMGQEEVREA